MTVFPFDRTTTILYVFRTELPEKTFIKSIKQKRNFINYKKDDNYKKRDASVSQRPERE